VKWKKSEIIFMLWKQDGYLKAFVVKMNDDSGFEMILNSP